MHVCRGVPRCGSEGSIIGDRGYCALCPFVPAGPLLALIRLSAASLMRGCHWSMLMMAGWDVALRGRRAFLHGAGGEAPGIHSHQQKRE